MDTLHDGNVEPLPASMHCVSPAPIHPSSTTKEHPISGLLEDPMAKEVIANLKNIFEIGNRKLAIKKDIG